MAAVLCGLASLLNGQVWVNPVHHFCSISEFLNTSSTIVQTKPTFQGHSGVVSLWIPLPPSWRITIKRAVDNLVYLFQSKSGGLRDCSWSWRGLAKGTSGQRSVCNLSGETKVALPIRAAYQNLCLVSTVSSSILYSVPEGGRSTEEGRRTRCYG